MILMVCAVFPPEPIVAASLTYDLANALAEIHPVTVLTPKPSRPFGFTFPKKPSVNLKFRQIVLPSYTCSKLKLMGRMRESYSFGKHVSRYIRENKNTIDYVYICAWPLFAPYLVTKTAKRFSIPSVVHVEDIYPESISNRVPFIGNLVQQLFLPMDKFILTNASSVIAVSENMKNHFIQTRKISPEKIALVQNWQDESQFIQFHNQKSEATVYTPKEKPFTFMYMGNIGPVAGVDFVIRSFAQAAVPNTRLIIAGSGSMKEDCMDLAQHYSESSILFLDVPAGKVPEIQDLADVMLLPVKRGAAMSSIPSKLVAYLFSKKPVIACVDGKSDTAQTIKNAQCGWVIPPEEPDKLAQLFQTISTLDAASLNQKGLNGFDFASSNFSKRLNLKKLVDFILIKSGHRTVSIDWTGQ